MSVVIKSIGTSGRDYSTLQAWEDALPANLVTDGNSQVGQVFNDSEFSGVGIMLTIAGQTTDVTNNITLTTGTGQSFRDNAGAKTNPLIYDQSKGVGITSSVSSRTIRIDSANVILSNLQIKNTGGGNPIDNGFTTLAITVDNCIFQGTAQGVSLGGTNAKIRNSCSIVSDPAGPGSIVSLIFGAKAYNCTFVSASNVPVAVTAIHTFSTAATLVNCAIFGAGILADSTTPNFTTCYSDLPGSGITQATYNNTQFVDTTSDWRISAGSAMKDTGTTDTTNAATDIVGTSRPQGSAYDVGAWEYVTPVAAPKGRNSINMQLSIGI